MNLVLFTTWLSFFCMETARARCGNRRVKFRHHSGPSGRLIRGQLRSSTHFYQHSIYAYPSSLPSQSMRTSPHACALLLCTASAIAAHPRQVPIQLPLSASSPSFETFGPVQRYDDDQVWRVKLAGEDIRRIEEIVDLAEVRTQPRTSCYSFGLMFCIVGSRTRHMENNATIPGYTFKRTPEERA